jgi:hypothetical protein
MGSKYFAFAPKGLDLLQARKQTKLLTILLISLFLISCRQQAERQHPNFIYLLADDLGYGDFSPYVYIVHDRPTLVPMEYTHNNSEMG